VIDFDDLEPKGGRSAAANCPILVIGGTLAVARAIEFVAIDLVDPAIDR
jgi:hypothetical protein